MKSTSPALWRALLVFVLFWTLPTAQAGSNSEEMVGVDRYGAAPIQELALRLNDELDARKVNVAIVARAGRPRSQLPDGVSYTHVAFIVFEPVVGADGTPFHTYAVYNLYQGPKGQERVSRLQQDLTYDFVAGVLEPDVAVCVPAEELQRRLLHAIRSPAYQALHIPDYNLAANPWVDRYDNCVTHTLKVCVAAIYQTEDRQRIYGNIRAYFHPTRIRLNLLETLGSSFVPDLRWEDAERGRLQTATYDSLRAFLESNGLVKETFIVRLAGH